MGYLLHLLSALFGVALAELGYGTESTWPWGVALLAFVPHAVAWWVKRQSLRGAFRSGEVGLRLLGRLAPLLSAAALLGCGWLRTLEGWFPDATSMDRWPHPALLLSLAPYFVYELLGIDARARLLHGNTRAFLRSRSFQVRMLASGALPMLVYVALTWLAGIDPTVRANVEEVAILEAAWSGGVLIVFAMLLPPLLRNTWDTEPLSPGPQRDLLERVAARAGFRCDRLLVWRTGHQMSNAAVVGFAPWHRAVLFTDLLLAQLGPGQLAAVFGHEIGHVKRFHVAIFAAWSLGFFLAGDVALRELTTQDPALLLGGMTALVLSWALGFGFLSRRFELEADLVALELTGDPEALVSALDRVAGLHSKRRSSWRHFSSDERKLFLRAAHRDAGVGRRLRHQLRRWRRFGVTLFAVALVLEIWTLAATWNTDRTYVDLRLGHYGAAVERSEAESPEGILARAAEPFGDGASAADFEAEARVQAVAQDWDAARSLLELAALLGSNEARTLLRGIDPDATPELREAAREAAPGDWRELLKSATPATAEE